MYFETLALRMELWFVLFPHATDFCRGIKVRFTVIILKKMQKYTLWNCWEATINWARNGPMLAVNYNAHTSLGCNFVFPYLYLSSFKSRCIWGLLWVSYVNGLVKDHGGERNERLLKKEVRLLYGFKLIKIIHWLHSIVCTGVFLLRWWASAPVRKSNAIDSRGRG